MEKNEIKTPVGYQELIASQAREAEELERRHQQPQPIAKATATNSLQGILNQAKRERGYDDSFGPDENPIVVKKPAATGGWLDLRQHRMDTQAPKDNVRSLIAGNEAGRIYDINAMIGKDSRVAQAGARIIVAADAPLAHPGPVIVWQQQAGALVSVEAAKFAPVVDGEDATDSDLSDFVHSAPISWPDAPSSAFTTTISRKTQRDHSYDVAQVVLDAILLGLAREADRVLLEAIVAARVGESFLMARAAEQGLKWGELRAISGAPAGGPDESLFKVDAGQLYYMSVPCEFTDTVTQNVIGAFNRAGVAIHPEIRIVAERLNVQGELRVTCYANLLPLLPRPGVFWL